MTTIDDSSNSCLCGCGQPVRPGRNWIRGHAIRGEGGGRPSMRALPDPGVPDDELDDIIAVGLDWQPAPVADVLGRSAAQLAADRSEVYAQPAARPDDDDDEDTVEPAHLATGKRERERAARPSRTGAKTRVTVALRKDVEAKIRFVAVPAGSMWASRDPQCGGTFMQQEPEISSALAEIVCDSPDLLAWFTGPTGKYMKFFNLFMACAPVGMAVYGHHLAHRGEPAPVDGQLPPQADYSAYAA